MFSMSFLFVGDFLQPSLWCVKEQSHAGYVMGVGHAGAAQTFCTQCTVTSYRGGAVLFWVWAAYEQSVA